MWRKGNTCVLKVRIKIGAATIENSMEFPQTIKNRTTYYSAILLLDIYIYKIKYYSDIKKEILAFANYG